MWSLGPWLGHDMVSLHKDSPLLFLLHPFVYEAIDNYKEYSYCKDTNHNGNQLRFYSDSTRMRFRMWLNPKVGGFKKVHSRTRRRCCVHRSLLDCLVVL